MWEIVPKSFSLMFFRSKIFQWYLHTVTTMRAGEGNFKMKIADRVNDYLYCLQPWKMDWRDAWKVLVSGLLFQRAHYQSIMEVRIKLLKSSDAGKVQTIRKIMSVRQIFYGKENAYLWAFSMQSLYAFLVSTWLIWSGDERTLSRSIYHFYWSVGGKAHSSPRIFLTPIFNYRWEVKKLFNKRIPSGDLDEEILQGELYETTHWA